MPSVSSGRIAKSNRSRKLTPHNKNHRWESFTSKIAKLHSLDPLRKIRRHDLDAEDLDATTSYLRNGLDRWADTNISKSFTSFKRELSPLCDSLAQILHFEQKIMDILATYLARQEKEALEPFLDLLIAFAHDLGVRFEKNYARALDLIVAIASKPQDVEVIEWTFAALAFLFKYLSRLLVPDLRPTYDVLAPLLGKHRQPTFIARFAAEAMSFLIKKAAAPAHRDTTLPMIVEHVQKDLASMVGTKQFVLYFHGIMTMFAEAIKSTGNTLHSTGPDTFRALIRAVPQEENVLVETTTWSDVCYGVLVSIVHHSTPETFPGMIDAIVGECSRVLEDKKAAEHPEILSLYIRLIGTAASVRRGQRISDWAPLVNSLSALLTTMSKLAENQASSHRFWQDVVVSVALTWIHASMDALIPAIAGLVKVMTREPFMQWFIPFCAHVSSAKPDRFRSLFLGYFQKFIVAHWSECENEELLCVLLSRMIDSGAIPSVHDKETFTLPQSWQDQIVSKFERLEATPFPERGVYDKDPDTWRDKCLPKYSSLLSLLEVSSVRSSTNARIAELLLRKLKLALRPSTSPPTEETLFIINHGLRAYLRMAREAGPPDASLGLLLKAAAPRFTQHVGFLEALLSYEKEKQQKQSQEEGNMQGESAESEEQPLIKALISNLCSPKQPLRLVSLEVLELLDTTQDHDSLFATMLQIERMPFDLPNARNIAVYFRKIGLSYPHLPNGSWLQDAVVSFLFGMLTVPLSPVWDDATQVLKQVADVKAGGEAISRLGFEWLDVASLRWSGPPKAPDGSRLFLTDFECLHLAKMLKSAKETEDIAGDVANLMLQEFQRSQQPAELHPTNARSKALKVFSTIPSLAERHSRQLVPHLFLWTDGQQTPVEDEPEDAEPEFKAVGWSLVDRKALVAILAQFNNPRSLYQSEKVYEALLKILANGDIEIQRNALKAILSWKQEGVKFYREALEGLLDESKFKNQLILLLQGEEGNQGILPEHRPALMPVLLRLLYGRTISKKGAASGRQGLNATRLAVIRNLDTNDVGSFLQIALGPLAGVKAVDSAGISEAAFAHDLTPARKQVGLLNMLESIITELGPSVESYMDSLVNAVLYCLISACRGLKAISEADEDTQVSNNASLLRVARTTSLRCLVLLFKNAPDFNWTLYQRTIVDETVSPNIDLLPVETAQGVSWSFKLMATWSELPKACSILAIDKRIIPSITDCLAVEKGKTEVKVFALRIIRNLVRIAQNEEVDLELRDLVKLELLGPNVEQILGKINALLRKQDDVNRELMEACVDTIVELAPLVQVLENVRDLVDISTFLLNQPARKVNPKIKGSLLLVLEHFISLHDMQADAKLKEDVYNTISSLFGFFKDRENRQTLARVFAVFASQQTSLQEVAGLCADLNSYVEGRLDEPDYDRRLAAFRVIARDRESPFTTVKWAPLLHNMVYYIRTDEEFGVLSSNSADCIITFASAAAGAMQEQTESAGAYTTMLTTVVLPVLYSGVREPSETIRREVVRTMASVASSLRFWEPLADLGPLIPTDEDDTDRAFFFNILSPAVSRQLQAMHLLESTNERDQFSSKNISQFFIPLLEHFIFGREEGSDDQGLGSQATTTIANLAESLEWQQFRAILRRFLGFIQNKPERQKQVLRLLDKIIDALSNAAKQSTQDEMELDDSTAQTQKRRLASTFPGTTKLTEDVTTNILPPLVDYLHEKDETTVSARVPVAIVVVKLLNILPIEVRDQKLPGVLTDVCHILRSKASESRDMARSTLSKVSAILGPTCFGFVLKELRGALARGSQLHVLSYTMHSLLIEVIPQFGQGELDYCIGTMIAIVMDDIFGITGQEKDAEEYNSKMKEVKSSKSKDSMELIAKNVSIAHLPELTRPIQALLLEKLDLKMVNKIDDLLSRITSGLLQNPKAETRETLVFCYEVIQEVYKAEKPTKEHKVDPRVRRYLIQKGASKNDVNGGSRTRYTHKLTKFALDILRTVFRKHESLRVASNISGFLPIIGDTVLTGADDVKVAAFKLLIVLIKVPFKANESSHLYQIAFKEAVKSIGVSTSTRSDMAQTSLRLISAILRDRREVAVKDHAIDMLLGRLKEDLTEPVYRDVTFNFVGSVLDRKVETAAVYDTLDFIGSVMITNDDASTRNLARGSFFQFLRDYPQKKNRWQKQLAFIVSNLKYEREGGRISVMEVLHLLLKSSADDFVQEVVATCFLPVVMVIANDESEKCYMIAGELVKEIFRRANNENLQNFLKLLRSWIEQEDKPAVLRLALQGFGFLFEAKDGNVKNKADVDLVIKKVSFVLEDAASEDRDLVTTSLQTTRILLDKFPSKSLARDTKGLWESLQECLSHSQSLIRLIAIQLLGGYLADFANNSESGKRGLVGSHGLRLDQDSMAELVRLILGIFTAEEVEQSLADEAVRILIFLGKFLDVRGKAEDAEDEDEESDDANQGLGLHYLFIKLAAIVRKESQPKPSSLIPKLAAAETLEALCKTTQKEHIMPSVRAILLPLRNLTDPSIPQPFSLDELFKSRYEDLKTKSQTIMDLLQKKLGTAAYTKALLAVSEEVKGRRQQRSTKRKIEAVAQPEKFGRDKRKKFEKKKERRKEKGQEHRTYRRGVA